MSTDMSRTRAQRIEERLDGWTQLADKYQAVVVGFDLIAEDIVDAVLEFPPEFTLEGLTVPAGLFRPPHHDPDQGNGEPYDEVWEAKPDWATGVDRVRAFGNAATRAKAQARMSFDGADRAFWPRVWELFGEFIRDVWAAVTRFVVGVNDLLQEERLLEQHKSVSQIQPFNSPATLQAEMQKKGYERVVCKPLQIQMLHSVGTVQLECYTPAGGSKAVFKVPVPISWKKTLIPKP